MTKTGRFIVALVLIVASGIGGFMYGVQYTLDNYVNHAVEKVEDAVKGPFQRIGDWFKKGFGGE